MKNQLDRIDFRSLILVIIERRYLLLAACLIYVSLINVIFQTYHIPKRLEISFQSTTPNWTNQRAYDIALLSETFSNTLASINEKNGSVKLVKSRASVYIDLDHIGSIQLEDLRNEIDNFATQTFKEELSIYDGSMKLLNDGHTQGSVEHINALRSMQLSVLPIHKVKKPLITSFKWIEPELNRHVVINGIALVSFTMFTLVFAYFVKLLSLIKRPEK